MSGLLGPMNLNNGDKMIYSAIEQLIAYSLKRELIQREDEVYCRNALLDALRLDSFEKGDVCTDKALEDILNELVDYAADNQIIGDSPAQRDAFSTRLMGLVTPAPSEVQRIFREKYSLSPQDATDWFYSFCQNCDYIRSYRTQRDLRFKAETDYGELDITINLSKPEKDPRDIAVAKSRKTGGYPACLLCMENEGYAGNIAHPARQNLRIIPLEIAGEQWGFQYSPYVYYNEHCIVLNSEHLPIVIDENVFKKLFTFVDQFPHYFVGSNADLPIVGGSILAHEHFQGGNYVFAMDNAPIKREICFDGFADVHAGIVRWPMSVIRLEGKDTIRLCQLGAKILSAWRAYSDESVGLLAKTKDELHNTITPIARKRGALYRLDLVLRNNRTSEEYPLGIFHPHEDKHNIKKENIGLIEVMGLAVLPARLQTEMEQLKTIVLSGGDLRADELTAKHAHWFEAFKGSYGEITQENIEGILHREIGKTFAAVLSDAGVFKDDASGEAAFSRFIHVAGASFKE